MAWIESHQSLLNHPKTRKAARLLGIPRVHLIGHLHALWWWAVDYAEDGDVSRYDAADLADAAEWDGDANEFIAALIDCGTGGGHGFIECHEDNSWIIHDWDAYAGKLIERRKADRERKRSAGKKPDVDAETVSDPAELQRSSSGSPTESERSPYVTNQPTVTNLDRNQPTNQPEPTDAPAALVVVDQPFDVYSAFLEETAEPDFKPAPAWKNKQLGIASRLLEQGFGADKVRRCTRYMRSQSWRTSPFDLSAVEKYIGTWEAAGMPEYEQPRGSPRNGRVDHVKSSIAAVDRVGDMIGRNT